MEINSVIKIKIRVTRSSPLQTIWLFTTQNALVLNTRLPGNPLEKKSSDVFAPRGLREYVNELSFLAKVEKDCIGIRNFKNA